MSRPIAPGNEIPPELLLRAYASGVFPMAEDANDDEVFWVRPDVRGVLPLNDFHVPKSLAKIARRAPFEITVRYRLRRRPRRLCGGALGS